MPVIKYGEPVAGSYEAALCLRLSHQTSELGPMNSSIPRRYLESLEGSHQVDQILAAWCK